MNYVLFNADGSIKRTNFTDIINQNNDGVNDIFVWVDGLEESGHSLTGLFVLPDGTISAEIGEWTEDVEYIDGEYKNGWVLTITESETSLPGIVYLTLQIEETATNKTLYTYRAALTINETASVSQVVNITLAQYTQIKNYIDSNFAKLDAKNEFTTQQTITHSGDTPLYLYSTDENGECWLGFRNSHSDASAHNLGYIGTDGLHPYYITAAGGKKTIAVYGDVEESYVPYSGARYDVNLGTHEIKTKGAFYAEDVSTESAAIFTNEGVEIVNSSGGDAGIIKFPYKYTHNTDTYLHGEFVTKESGFINFEGDGDYSAYGIKFFNDEGGVDIVYTCDGIWYPAYDSEDYHEDETIIRFPKTQLSEKVAYESFVIERHNGIFNEPNPDLFPKNISPGQSTTITMSLNDIVDIVNNANALVDRFLSGNTIVEERYVITNAKRFKSYATGDITEIEINYEYRVPNRYNSASSYQDAYVEYLKAYQLRYSASNNTVTVTLLADVDNS